MNLVRAWGVIVIASGAIVSCAKPSVQSGSDRERNPALDGASEVPALQVAEMSDGDSLESSSDVSSSGTKDVAEQPASQEADVQVRQKDALRDLMLEANKKVKEAYASENNIMVSGVAFGLKGENSKQSCIFVQIRQGKGRGTMVKETLTPAGQPEVCKPSHGQKARLGLGSMSFIARKGFTTKNNYVGGIGAASIGFDGVNLAGCAAGAVGYASEDFNAADGTAGAFCSQVVLPAQ